LSAKSKDCFVGGLIKLLKEGVYPVRSILYHQQLLCSWVFEEYKIYDKMQEQLLDYEKKTMM